MRESRLIWAAVVAHTAFVISCAESRTDPMRLFFAAILVFATALPAIAQAPAPPPSTTPMSLQPDPPPAIRGAKPKDVAVLPVRAVALAPADAAAQAERTAIQSDLAWVGLYNGAINGEPGERMTAAIKAWQKDNGGKPTGMLTAPERVALAEAAKKPQENVGWKIVTDSVTGARLGIPSKLIAQQTSDINGSRWTSSTGTIQIVLSRRKDAAPTIAKIVERERKEPAGRRIDYAAVKPDFFVLSGMQGLKKFYARGQIKDGELRVLTVLYDQAVEGTMEPVVIAMSSAFVAFPVGVQASPPPRRSVEYATGVVVSDGAVVTDRQATDGCLSLVVAGYGNADRVAEDKPRELALLRVYGARGLSPLALGSGSAKPVADIVGIADPQNQGGGNAVSVVKAQASGGAEPMLNPAPGMGFSGAVARDAEGGFAGLAILKPVQVAGPAAAPQAALVPAEVVRGFLKANGIGTGAAAADAKASVVRVICVRKS